MNTVAFDRPGLFARIAGFFTAVVEIFREAREMRATFGGKYDE
jgi:protein-S-isoprenylcysteine O-methyltransferase Ste14